MTAILIAAALYVINMSKWRYTTFHYFYSADLWLESNAETRGQAINYLQEKYEVDNLHNSCVKELYDGNIAWQNKNEECVQCIR